MEWSKIRKAKLLGVRAAEELHAKLNIKQHIKDGATQVDILQAIETFNIPVLFRPLEGLLGVFLREPTPGILITTKRKSYIQRYTAAHELGHYYLQHEASYDDERIIGNPSVIDIAQGGFEETQAEAFAAALLMPKWLIVKTTNRAKWKKADLKQPFFVYQMAIRLGVSYTAVCIALKESQILNAEATDRLQQKQPQQIKQATQLSCLLASSWSNILYINRNEYQLAFKVEEGDIIVIDTPSHKGSSQLIEYLRSIKDVELLESNNCNHSPRYMNFTVVIFKGIGVHHIKLANWPTDSTEQYCLDLRIDFAAPESGLSKSIKDDLLDLS